MASRTLLALLLATALSACGGTPAAVKSAPAKPAGQAGSGFTPARPVVRSPITAPPPAAKVQVLPGLEGVIGVGPAELTRQFGSPRLDVVEGDARKLQFSGPACVLDVYLYPQERGREMQATYVDARRASDGQEVDRAACVSALRKR